MTIQAVNTTECLSRTEGQLTVPNNGAVKLFRNCQRYWDCCSHHCVPADTVWRCTWMSMLQIDTAVYKRRLRLCTPCDSCDISDDIRVMSTWWPRTWDQYKLGRILWRRGYCLSRRNHMIFYCSVVSRCLRLPRHIVVSQLLLPELQWWPKSDQTCSVKSEKERSLIRLTGHMNWFSGRFKTYQELRSHTFQEETILSSFLRPCHIEIPFYTARYLGRYFSNYSTQIAYFKCWSSIKQTLYWPSETIFRVKGNWTEAYCLALFKKDEKSIWSSVFFDKLGFVECKLYGSARCVIQVT